MHVYSQSKNNAELQPTKAMYKHIYRFTSRTRCHSMHTKIKKRKATLIDKGADRSVDQMYVGPG